ncbi:MAG: ECF transporter S component, partial [Defluviitaleaceae bacterium]|nr:ECF transporter S component [Defluviitaleaceae bacterium]
MNFEILMGLVLGVVFIGLVFLSKRMAQTEWKLQDIILSSILGGLFAVICFITVLVGMGPLVPLFALLGLSGLEFEVVWGIFLMSAVLAPYVMQKPGVATLVGFLTGFLQVLIGSPFAATVWLSGLVQGVGAEMGYALFGYKKWNLATTLIAATGATITSFILAWYRGSWTDL